MKRLSEARFDASGRAWLHRQEAQRSAWDREEAWWVSIGLEPRIVHAILIEAGQARSDYESKLHGERDPRHADVPNDDPGGPHPGWQGPEKRRYILRLLRDSKPLVEFLKTERDGRGNRFFSDLGDVLEDRLKAYQRRYLLDRRPRPRLPRHRPGEPWLARSVVQLAELFHDIGTQSWSRTVKGIFDALVLAGHGDVVSHEKVKHLLRPLHGNTSDA